MNFVLPIIAPPSFDFAAKYFHTKSHRCLRVIFDREFTRRRLIRLDVDFGKFDARL